jgi:hypothetical protein
MGKSTVVAALALVAMLLPAAARADPCDDLADAAEVGDTAGMAQLMKQGVRGDCLSDAWEGATPLHIAAESYEIAAVRLLLRSGVSPNVRDGKYKETPLASIKAQLEGDPCTGNCAEVAKLLREAGGR